MCPNIQSHVFCYKQLKLLGGFGRPGTIGELDDGVWNHSQSRHEEVSQGNKNIGGAGTFTEPGKAMASKDYNK